MGTDTKMRPAGMLVGRCMVGMTDSPRNRWGGAEDGVAQPDGAKFVAYGENHLSAAPNRALFALGHNVDVLNGILNRGWSDTYELSLAAPFTDTIDLGTLLPDVPVAIGTSAPAAGDYFYLIDQTNELPVFDSTGTIVTVDSVQNADTTSPWVNPVIETAKTIRAVGRYYVEISGACSSVVQAGQIAYVQDLGASYDGYYLITNVETVSGNGRLWLGPKLTSYDTLAFTVCSDRETAYREMEISSPLTLTWTEGTSIPTAPAPTVTVYSDGFFKPNLLLKLSGVPVATGLLLYFGVPVQRGMPFNKTEVSNNRKLAAVAEVATTLSLQDAYDGGSQYTSGIDAGAGNYIGVNGPAVIFDSRVDDVEQYNNVVVKHTNTYGGPCTHSMLLDDTPNIVTYNGIQYRLLDDDYSFRMVEENPGDWYVTELTGRTDTIVTANDVFDGTSWLRRPNGQVLGDLLQLSSTLWVTPVSQDAHGFLVNDIYVSGNADVAAADYTNCKVYRAIITEGVGAHHGVLSLQEPGDASWVGLGHPYVLGAFSCAYNAVNNNATYTSIPLALLSTGVYDHPGRATHTNLGVTLKPYDFRLVQSPNYPAAAHDTLIVLDNADYFTDAVEGGLLAGANVVIASDNITVNATSSISVSSALDVAIEAHGADVTLQALVHGNVDISAADGVLASAPVVDVGFAYGTTAELISGCTNANSRVSIGSVASTISVGAVTSAVLASETCEVAVGTNRAAAIASDSCTISGTNAASLAAETSYAYGTDSAVIASSGSTTIPTKTDQLVAASNLSTTAGHYSAVLASNNGIASGPESILVASISAELSRASCIGGGVGGASIILDNSNQNLNWYIDSANTGDIIADAAGSWHSDGWDYAEYFENAAIGELPSGVLVTRVGRKIQLAELGDRILGVVSAHPSIVGGGAGLNWSGKFEKDEFGKTIRVMGDNGIMVPKVAPDYDPSHKYVPRHDRPEEWTCVGLIGQLHVRIDATVTSDTLFIAPGTAGVGTHSDAETRCELMEITTPYTEEKGYGVALCLIR